MVSEILPNYALLDGICKYVGFEHCTHDLPDNHPGKVRLKPDGYYRGLTRQSTRTIRLRKGRGQQFGTPVYYRRFGCPDIGVGTSPFVGFPTYQDLRVVEGRLLG
jgi:hypothetical protein